MDLVQDMIMIFACLQQTLKLFQKGVFYSGIKTYNTSNFAKHLIQEAHSFGPMSNIMQIVHCHRKGAHLNTIERFHIHTEFAANNHLNDPQTIIPNAIFNTLTKANLP